MTASEAAHIISNVVSRLGDSPRIIFRESDLKGTFPRKPIPRPTVRRRLLRRRYLRHIATEIELTSKGLAGRVLNVSETGLAIETSARPVVGKSYQFTLADPEITVAATARVRWCVLRRTTPAEGGDVLPIYFAGLSFEEVDSGALDRLLERAKALRRAIR